MENKFRIELTRERVVFILDAFVRGDISSDELKTWAVLVMNAKERDGLLDYDTSVGDVIFGIEMSEAYDPITLGKARDFIRELS